MDTHLTVTFKTMTRGMAAPQCMLDSRPKPCPRLFPAWCMCVRACTCVLTSSSMMCVHACVRACVCVPTSSSMMCVHACVCVYACMHTDLVQYDVCVLMHVLGIDQFLKQHSCRAVSQTCILRHLSIHSNLHATESRQT